MYILVMLGISFIFLSFAEKIKGKLSQYVVSLGRVPMFFYIVHIYLIHILALIAALATGFSVSDMTFTTWITDSKNLKGYGFNLLVVYVVWISVVLLLYPLCLWYEHYKANHKEKWWLSYL
jgi:ABC-type multidrug transport system fused ATPase/permease subunit